MKITGASSAGPVGPSAASRPAGGDGFSVAGGATGAAATPRTGATGSVASLDALLALQETGGPLERRRRALRRADRLLEGLEALRLSLIEGAVSPTMLDGLRHVRSEHRDDAGDPSLEALLDQVDLRAAVELAKLERPRAA